MLYQIPAFFQDTFLSCVLPSCLLSISHLVIHPLFSFSSHGCRNILFLGVAYVMAVALHQNSQRYQARWNVHHGCEYTGRN
jgi:hypothetical protein